MILLYILLGLYALELTVGLALSWLIQRYGTFGSEYGYITTKPPQNTI
jgi:hypothetical protein